MRTFMIALLLMLLIITPCFAKTNGTPDGKTPHVETVCDGETGAAFGLCNTYCEAMDCDSDYPYASEEACSNIKNLFTNHTGRNLPCEQDPVCPCLEEIPEFAAFLENPDDFLYCYDTGSGGLLGIGSIADVQIITNGMDEVPICAYLNKDDFPRIVKITYEELEICEQLILDAILNAELNCE